MTAPHSIGDPLWSLENLAAARQLCDWMYAQYSDAVHGAVAEGGIGTFSERLLAAGAESLLLVEPEPACADELERHFAGDPRVELARDVLPGSPALAARAGELDFIVCQNVLEHIEEDRAATAAMASALRPGGQLTILVPAHQRLYGSLDRSFGHHRRYSRPGLRAVIESTGLEVLDLYSFNLLGVPGWWVQSRLGLAEVSARSLRTYEALLRLWHPIERRVRPPWGLSLIAHARRPAGANVAGTQP